MKMINKVLAKLRSRMIHLRLWLQLRHRVKGRIKLRGNLERLVVSPSFKCDGDLWLGIYSEAGEIIIGDNVSASGPLIVTAIQLVKLGNGVLLGPNIMVTDHYHGNPRDISIFEIQPSKRSLHTRGPIIIEDFVQIGANVSVLSPSKIGRAAIIGANSVVSGSVAEKTVFIGTSARPINPKTQQA